MWYETLTFDGVLSNNKWSELLKFDFPCIIKSAKINWKKTRNNTKWCLFLKAMLVKSNNIPPTFEDCVLNTHHFVIQILTGFFPSFFIDTVVKFFSSFFKYLFCHYTAEQVDEIFRSICFLYPFRWLLNDWCKITWRAGAARRWGSAADHWTSRRRKTIVCVNWRTTLLIRVLIIVNIPLSFSYLPSDCVPSNSVH